MDDLREKIYAFIFLNFTRYVYEKSVEDDDEPEEESSFTQTFPNYEQFKVKQRLQINELSEEDVRGALWLSQQIKMGEIESQFNPPVIGFFYFHDRLILFHED